MVYPLEAKLRPAVEANSALGFLTGSVVTAIHPSWLLLPPVGQASISAGLMAMAIYRGWQAWDTIRYRRNLRVLKLYKLTSQEIPWSREGLFLGLGFRWDQRHTQRLIDASKPAAKEKYVLPSRLYETARQLEFRVEHDPSLAWVSRLTRSPSRWNPVAPLPDLGGNTALHGVEPNEYPVYMSLSNRVGHTRVLGTTRVGKSRLSEILLTQDIRRGDVVVFFDPKGDVGVLRRMYAEAKRANRPFYVFHLGYPDISARYNPTGDFSRITEVATRTADPLPSEGNSAAFKEFVWRFVNVLAKAMVTLGERPDFKKIYAYAVDTESLAMRYLEHWLNRIRPDWQEEFEAVEDEMQKSKAVQEQAKKTGRAIRTVAILQYIREHSLRDSVADALISVLGNDRTYFEKLVSSLYPLLEKLTTGRMAELISPDYADLNDERPIFEWMSVINQRAVVYIGLDSLSDHEVASAVGTSMFADLTSVAGQIYKYGVGAGQLKAAAAKLSLHADEFNELVGDAFIPMVNKAGGAGYQVTAYTQTWSDVEAKIGSAAKADQISGNFNTLVMMRVENTATADILVEKLPEVEVNSIVQGTRVTDTDDPTDFAAFTSANEDKLSTERVPMLSASDLVQLPKGQAFCLIDGGQLYKIRIPLADDSGDPMLPHDLAAMVQDMEQRRLRHEQQQALTMEGKGSGW